MVDLILHFGYPLLKSYLIIEALFILLFSLIEIFSTEEATISLLDYFLILLFWPAVLHKLSNLQ
jgi:hypothetical protein